MMDGAALREDLAAELASFGDLERLYVRQGSGLVEVRGRRGRAARWGRSRFLGGDSALVRTLESWPGILVRRLGEGDPFGEALLEELDAEAVVLMRHRGRLLAAASLQVLNPTTPLVEADLRHTATRFATRLARLENTSGSIRNHDAYRGTEGDGTKISDRE